MKKSRFLALTLALCLILTNAACAEQALEKGVAGFTITATTSSSLSGELQIYDNVSADEYQQALVWLEANGYAKYASASDGEVQAVLVEKDDGEFMAAHAASVQRMFFVPVDYGKREGLDGNATAMFYAAVVYRASEFAIEDYAKSVVCYEKAAEMGETSAYRRLGDAYRYEQYGMVDYAKAAAYYLKGVECDDTMAMLRLGYMYKTDEFGMRDETKAIEYLTMAMEKGNGEACGHLGDLYRNAGDCAKAEEMYILAVDRGSTSSLSPLGYLYQKEEYGRQDVAKAVEYYEQAVAAGETNAYLYLGDISRYDEYGRIDYPKAAEMYAKAVESGNVTAMCRLGDMYYYEECGMQNYAEAAKLYAQAAELGHEHVMPRLAEMYNSDEYGMENKAEAAKWYIRAAEAGQPGVYNWAGFYAANPLEGEADYERALKYYMVGADEGDGYCMWQIGLMYKDGRLTAQPDMPKTVKWFTQAAEAGESRAMVDLAKLLNTNEYGVENMAEAARWYICAAEAGRADACDWAGYYAANPVEGEADYELALKYYTQGAEDGSTYCMRQIANLYRDGLLPGGENEEEAQKWDDKADAAEAAGK